MCPNPMPKLYFICIVNHIRRWIYLAIYVILGTTQCQLSQRINSEYRVQVTRTV